MIVVWRVTERCNRSCPFCAYDRTLSRSRRDVDEQMVERFCRVLGEYRRTTGERILLSWLGGEPLLWRPVFEVSHRLRQTFQIEVSATTNGTTLHLGRVQRHILECFSELTVSVDGFAEFHEHVRGWPGGWHQLRDAVQTLAQARTAMAAQLKLRANVVLMRDNLTMFADLCEALAGWGFDEITFNQLGGRDRPAFFSAHRLRRQDSQTLSAILPRLRSRLARRGVRLCGSGQYLRRIDASTHDISLAVNDCAPGESFLFVDERGRVSPCSFTSENFGLPLKAVCSVDGLLSLPGSFATARERKPAPVCNDCPSTHVFAKFAV